MIEAVDLVCDYPGRPGPAVRALDGVSFRCGAGEIAGILGSNGAGKSTLLRVLAGLIRPRSGRCRLAGVDVAAYPDEARARLGLLGEQGGPSSTQTPRWHLALHAGLLGLGRAEAFSRADACLRAIGLESRGDGQAGTLSRGQRQRVGLARAFLGAPRVLLLDEPSAGLDIEAAAWMREWILQRRKAGISIVLASHDPRELERLADSLLLLDAGRVVASGPTRTIRGRSRSLEEACLSLLRECR